jgi:hypothetical protein
MKFLVEVATATTDIYNRYNIYEVDEGVYYTSPIFKSNPFWRIANLEFYFSKVNGKWVGEKDETEDKEVPEYLVEEISSEFEIFLNKAKLRKAKKINGKWVIGND